MDKKDQVLKLTEPGAVKVVQPQHQQQPFVDTNSTFVTSVRQTVEPNQDQADGVQVIDQTPRDNVATIVKNVEGSIMVTAQTAEQTSFFESKMTGLPWKSKI